MDIEGKLLGFDPAAATADAERVKHRLEQHLLGADHAERETYGSMTTFTTHPGHAHIGYDQEPWQAARARR